MSHTQHQKLAASISAKYAIITISDTRDRNTDKSGQKLISLLNNAGHKLLDYRITKDEPADIKTILFEILKIREIDLIITTGGTGIANRDNTIPIINEIIDQKLDGFGELFRMLSYHEIGAAAMLSRATGGKTKNGFVFALPGSVNAVQLAMKKLILPQIAHLIYEKNK